MSRRMQGRRGGVDAGGKAEGQGAERHTDGGDPRGRVTVGEAAAQGGKDRLRHRLDDEDASRPAGGLIPLTNCR